MTAVQTSRYHPAYTTEITLLGSTWQVEHFVFQNNWGACVMRGGPDSVIELSTTNPITPACWELAPHKRLTPYSVVALEDEEALSKLLTQVAHLPQRRAKAKKRSNS